MNTNDTATSNAFAVDWKSATLTESKVADLLVIGNIVIIPTTASGTWTGKVLAVRETGPFANEGDVFVTLRDENGTEHEVRTNRKYSGYLVIEAAPTTRRVVRTTNPNGTYRYEIDGDVIYKASKVLYTHVSRYSVGTGNDPILFHKTESAANKATGYRNNGWVKTGVQVIEDGDTAPLAPVVDEPTAAPATIELWETFEGQTHAYDTAGNRVIEISERVRDTRWTVATNVRHWTVLGDGITRHGVLASGTADGLRAAKRAALAAWAEVMATPAPAPRKAPRNRAKVVPNQGAPTHLVGRHGRVLGKHTGDDGKLYVDVDFGEGGEWPFLVHELDLV